MGYINVFLSSPCKISIIHRQLVVQGEELEKFPLEDLNCLLFESHECTVTSYALQSLAEHNVAVFLCDKYHMPSGALLPFNGYYRQKKTLDLQISLSKPLQKQLWTQIVKQKITNQAEVCKLNALEEYVRITALVKEVNSGDTTNVEAIAANIYFKILFGKGFSRQNESGINACLNYGYAILRGLISRTLVAYGFQPCIGLHHCNELNSFNLADDIIESFRPVVDLLVFNNIGLVKNQLDTTLKKLIFGIVNTDVLINNQMCSLSYAVELVVQTLLSSITKGTNELSLPNILPIKSHSYE